jgi:hypothetical protein
MAAMSPCLHLCIFGLFLVQYASSERERVGTDLSEKARSCAKKQITNLVGDEVGDFLHCAMKTCRGVVTSDENSSVLNSSEFSNLGLLGTDLVEMTPAELSEFFGLQSPLAECVAQSIAIPTGYTMPELPTHEPSTLSGQCDDPHGRCTREQRAQSGGLFWTRERDAELDAEATRHGQRACDP